MGFDSFGLLLTCGIIGISRDIPCTLWPSWGMFLASWAGPPGVRDFFCHLLFGLSLSTVGWVILQVKTTLVAGSVRVITWVASTTSVTPYTCSQHHTTLLVFKRFFSALDIFVAVSAVVRAAPIVGAAVWDEYARLRWTNFLFTSSTSFNQQTSFLNIFLAICLLCPTISLPGLQWHPLAATSECTNREHIKHMGREWQFESFTRNIIDAVFFSI